MVAYGGMDSKGGKESILGMEMNFLFYGDRCLCHDNTLNICLFIFLLCIIKAVRTCN